MDLIIVLLQLKKQFYPYEMFPIQHSKILLQILYKLLLNIFHLLKIHIKAISYIGMLLVVKINQIFLLGVLILFLTFG